MASASGGQVEAVRFRLNLLVKDPHKNDTNLSIIQRNLTDKISEFRQYLIEKKKLPFIHICEVYFVEENSALFAEFEVWSKEELVKFKKASKSGTLVGAFRSFSKEIKLYNLLKPKEGFKFKLFMQDEEFAKVMEKLVEQEHLKISSVNEAQDDEVHSNGGINRKSDVSSRQGILTDPERHGSKAELQSGGALKILCACLQIDTASCRQDPIKFSLRLMVSSEHNTGRSLRLIQEILQENLNELCNFLNKEKKMKFLHPSRVTSRDNDSAVFVEFEIFSREELEEFKEAAKGTQLTSALTSYANSIKLSEILPPSTRMVRLYLTMSTEIYSKVLISFTEREGSIAHSSKKVHPVNAQAVEDIKKQDQHLRLPMDQSDERTKDRMSPQVMQENYISKQFMVYVPNPNDYYIKKVEMICKKQKEMNKVKLCNISHSIYGCTIELPVSSLADEVLYIYQVHCSSNMFTYFRSTILDSSQQCIYHTDIQRDCMYGFDKYGFTAHLKNIIYFQIVHSKKLKNQVMQIEGLLKGKTIDTNDCKTIIEWITKELTAHHQIEAVLCVVLVGNLLERQNPYILGTIEKDKARWMLSQLKNYRLADFPSSCDTYLPATCRALSQIAQGTEYSLLVTMDSCCPFLNEGHFNKWIEEMKKEVVFAREKDTIAAQSLTTYVIHKIKETMEANEPIHELQKLVINIATHCPVKVGFIVCNCLQDCKMKEVEDILIDVVEIMFYLTFTEVQNGLDILILLDLYTIVSKHECRMAKYAEKFEQGILECLEKSTSIANGAVNQIVYLERMFCNKESQTALIELLSSSSNFDLHTAFLQVLTLPKFKTCLCELNSSIIENWFQMLISTHLGLINHESIETLYTRLFQILKIVSEPLKPTLLEKLDHLTVGYMKRGDVIEVIQALNNMESVCPPEHLEMCVEHLKTVLQTNKRKLKTQKVLDTMKDGDGTVVIDSRLAATVLCFLLDTNNDFVNPENRLECLLTMSTNQELWASVYSARGHRKSLVEGCSTYTNGMSAILSTLKLLTTHRIPFKFFSKGKIGDHSVRSLLYLTKYSKHEIDEILAENKKELQKKKEEITVIQAVINVIQERMNAELLPENFSQYTEQIDILVARFDSICLPEFQSQYWNLFQYQNMFKQCELSSDVVLSQVYWNTYRRTGECSSEQFYADDSSANDILEALCLLFEEVSINTPSDNVQCTQFVCRLLETANKTYSDEWKLIQDNQNIDIKRVFQMFKGCFQSVNKEIEWAETHLRHKIADHCKTTLKRLSNLEKMINIVDIMEKAVKAFDLDVNEDERFKKAITSFRQLIDEDSISFTLKEVAVQIDVVFQITDHMDDSTTDVLEAVGRSSSLIAFLGKIIDEDIRNLIDAVEDISEQHVSESTVSALIEVKRFFRPILISLSEQNCIQVLESVQKQVKDYVKVVHLLPSKIEDCMNNLHNLISLYNNVANRGEQTKQIIQNLVKQGKFHFQLKAGEKLCDFTASYAHKTSQKVVHTKSALSDFRSRALLLMNSERKGQGKSMADLEKFVNAINVCSDVSENIFTLHLFGHMKFLNFNQTVAFKKLHDLLKSLETELQSWNEHLKLTRENFYLMNFVQGTHMHTLGKFLQSKTNHRNVNVILKFIHPKMNAEMLEQTFDENHMAFTGGYEDLMNLGQALTSCYEKLDPFKRAIKTTDDKARKMTDIVENGKILVARIDEAHVLVVKTLLALYLRTSNRLPEPSEVLLCSRETTWSDVELLLWRCIGAYQFFGKDTLYCIANVEVLPSEMQFRLVEILKNLDKNSNFMLSIICQGTSNHPFVDEFYENVTAIRPLSDGVARSIFSEFCPAVHTYTSDFAGLGKSTAISIASKNSNRSIKTIHVSGPIQKRKLIGRLHELHLHNKDSLHIDIGYLDNPLELDMFLFELIILNYVIADGEAMNLPTTHVYIEIANTINNTLRNSLQTAVSFKREHKTWQNYSDFIVSNDVNSPVQVVCQYLYSLEKGVTDVTDIKFSGETCAKVLPGEVCRNLMRNYLHFGETFITTKICINVLADQLKKMSNSGFFITSRIRDMTGPKLIPTIKTSMVKALLEVSKELASRSVEAYRTTQQQTVNTGAETNTPEDLAAAVIRHVKHMVRWEESNHLIYIFHNQNIQTISPMYRQIDLVPGHVKELFESQMKRPLCDFKALKQIELQDVLQKVARTNPAPLEVEKLKELSEDYALTPDNLLKMVLIILRIRARVPVLVMGETGCGKTSLIRYLASICEVPFDVVSIHAGVDESVIIQRVVDNNEKALQQLTQEHWVFLDEINTSEYIGLISDMICHHKCLGKTLAPNLILLAACNPYRLRSSKSILSSGLKGKVKTDELSRLVYRVLPLPENLVDYVWDFGSLTDNDEKMYIARMVGSVFNKDTSINNLFVDLLSMSQIFSRTNEETTSSVSLRDIQRCKILTEWFVSIFMKKIPKEHSSYYSCVHDKRIPAIILALAHCYLSRFSDTRFRKQYIANIEEMCTKHDHLEYSASFIQKIIREEQRDILLRMDLPPGTALNTALQENVFVLLVCILNRIPIFVVGKPGCSKSLSMQVIKSNLRGKDSKDEFFKSLPQLYCVSFQGSESSTSDGILKVFEKAEKYQEANSTDDVLSVVILDEIGLAEISRFNPLKVLHNLLEPDGRRRPNVAVVGISNWSLDASKMNRAIHLSRPEMDADELTETAKSISDSFQKEENKIFLKQLNDDSYSFETYHIIHELEKLARSYTAYIEALRFENFHGLRDYYSLVKDIARKLSSAKIRPSEEQLLEVLCSSVHRNFGGLPSERVKLLEMFDLHSECFSPVLELVVENVTDPLARHLMIITTGESVLGIIERSLKQAGKDKREILFGSQFEEDLTDDYNYRMLSRIILCMEQGIVLILKDLESIYGSLYDMLNKNYTQIGKKKHCRVALGAYSNPICHVHEDFRCIVLIDETQVDFTDPPFLNRFEKQNVRFSDIISAEQQAAITEVEKWSIGFTQIEGRNFSAQDCFPIYGKDMVASYVLEKDNRENWNEDFREDFLWIIKPENIIRMKCSSMETTQKEADLLQTKYFSLPLHDGIHEFLKYQEVMTEICNSMTIIFTNSNIHSRSLYNATDRTVQIEKLGAFKSEKQLSSRLQLFWLETDKDILFVQCSAIDDEKHIMLAKSIIERERNEFLSSKPAQSKSVYLIVHLDKSKGRSKVVSQINFLSGWQLVMLDSLESPSTPLPQLCRLSLYEAVMAKRPMNSYIKDQLFWTFTRIKYTRRGRDVDSINKVLKRMKGNASFIHLVEEYVCSWISASHSEEQNNSWQEHVACNPHALDTSLTLVDALEKHICQVINTPLSKFIYQMDVMGILESYFVEDDTSAGRRKAWKTMLANERIFSISDVHDEHGPETYECQTEDLALKMPFSLYIFNCIETTRDEFLNSVIMLQELCDLDEDDNLPPEVMKKLLLKQEMMILHKIPNAENFTYENWMDDYLDDFCNLVSIQLCTNLDRLKRCNAMKWGIKQKMSVEMKYPSEFFTALHTTFWSNAKLFEAQIELFEICQSGVFVDDEMDWVNNIIQELSTLEETEGMEVDRSDSETNINSGEQIYSRDKQINTIAMQDHLYGPHNENNVDEEDDSNIFQMASDVVLTEKDHSSSICEDNDSTNASTESDLFEIHESSETAVEEIDNIDDTDASDIQSLTGEREMSAPYKLVQILCKKLLPTAEIVNRYGGLSSWQRIVNTQLRLAANVSNESASLHKLRFCNDLASNILLPDKSRSIKLEQIANLLKQGKALDSKTLFRYVLDFLNDPEHQSGDVCQRMFSNYLMRCLSLDPETNAVYYLFKTIVTNKIPDINLSYLKLPLSTVLKSNSKNIQVFVSLLHDDVHNVEENASIFISLDECIKALYEIDGATPLANLIIDIIAEVFEELFSDFSKETDINALFLDGQTGLSRDFGLSFLTAVACCRSFIFKTFLNDNALSEESPSAILPVFRFSETEETENASLCWYFLKILSLKRPLAKLWLQIKSLEKKCPTFKEIKWSNETIDGCTEMCPLKAHAPDTINNLVNILKVTCEPKLLSEKIGSWFTEHKNTDLGLISLYGAVIQHFYLPNLYKNTEDTKTEKASVILEEAKKCSLSRENIRFLERLLGEQEFDATDFIIHQGSNSTDFYLSSVLISLYSLLFASVETSPGTDMPVLAKCLQNPRDVKNLYLPGMPGSVTGKSTNDALHDVFSNTVVCTCTCGVRLCLMASEELKCSYCGNGLELEDVTDLSTECDTKTGFVQSLDGMNFSVRNLSPVVYHILSILSNGSLLGSVALGNASTNELEDIGVSENATEYLWNDLEEHWQSILLLLNVDECILSGIFQVILLEIRELICKNTTQMITEMERKTWEETFVSSVENVISNRFQFLQELFHLHESSESQTMSEVEGYVRDFHVSEITTERMKATHQGLFKLRGKPSFENFLYEFEKQKEDFLFLQLVLQTYKDLSLPKHILAIVQWHVFVVSNVSYIIKRDTCFNITVSQFLHQTDKPEERDKRRKRFSDFKKTWDVLKETFDKCASFESLSRLNGESKLNDCLILDEKSVILRALQKLVRIQNQFLDKALSVSHVCKATQFLNRTPGQSMIQCIDITKVTSKQLVDFSVSWDACIAPYSQSHYVHGRQIVYDIHSIEKFFAVHLLNGKAYINLGDTLPRIVFADEMYRNFALLVAEIHVCVKQTALPKHTIDAIHSNHEKDPHMATELLTRLGILMALIKKTEGDPELPLVDYAENWEKLLTRALPSSLLPSPASCIKLCHVVSLHEVLEELTAISIVDGLEEEFQKPIDIDMERHLIDLVKQKVKIAEITLGTLKRFVFRCLSVRDVEPITPMKRFMSDGSFWPAGCLIDGEVRFGSETATIKDVIPEGLMVSQIYSTVTFLDEEIEKKRTKAENMTQIASSFKTKRLAFTPKKAKMNQKKKTIKLWNF